MNKNFERLDVGKDIKEVKVFMESSLGILKQAQEIPESSEEEYSASNSLNLTTSQEEELFLLSQEFSATYNVSIESSQQMVFYIRNPEFADSVQELEQTFTQINETLQNGTGFLPMDNQIVIDALNNIIPVFENNRIRLQDMSSFIGPSGKTVHQILET